MFDNYPDWSQEFARKYLSRTINTFLLHGNVHDLVPLQEDETTEFHRLKSFLSDEFFGARDYVIFYDRSSGIYFRDKESQADFNQAIAGRDSLVGTDYAKRMPKDPVRVFSLLEQYFRLRLDQKKSIALIIDYAETIIPMSDAGSTGNEDRTALVYLSRWAHDPMFLASDFTHVMITENLADLNKTLIQNPYTTEIKITIPGEKDRLSFIKFETSDDDFDKLSDVKPEIIAQQTVGLNYVNIRSVLSNARENEEKITFESLSRNKKELIEAEAYGLLEFVETQYSL
ncbi:MAG: AAA family ATPase, partial [Balneolaceae bacterium]